LNIPAELAHAPDEVLALERLEHRERRTRERRAANIRFWVIVLALLALSVFLSIEMWQQVQNLFGL
jgi:predicted nucleic acid-binding Zn ribbon protein